MFSLKVLKDLQHPDGRIFSVGHDCRSLTLFELAELVNDFPGCFEGADEITTEAIADKPKMEHYAAAVKEQNGLRGNLSARKQ